MNRREEIIDEIRRVSSRLGVSNLPKAVFARNSKLSPNTVSKIFGSWNRAVEAAGLEPIRHFTPEHEEIPDEVLLEEVIRLTKQLGKQPSDREMQALGKFSPKPYIRRWGSFVKGREIAYKRLGIPDLNDAVISPQSGSKNVLPNSIILPITSKPIGSPRKKIQFGEPIDFRGLRFAPINEQGVVYLFGMVSRELGFLIESIRTEYPDCEGKRCTDKKENRWEHIAGPKNLDR